MDIEQVIISLRHRGAIVSVYRNAGAVSHVSITKLLNCATVTRAQAEQELADAGY